MKRTRILLAACLGVLALGYLLPERVTLPVANAKPGDWNPRTFWYEPWGASGVHKGIDVFGARGTAVLSVTDGLVVFAGTLRQGGNVLLVLGPSWRLHYFAHLESVQARPLDWVASGEVVATLGDSGNARGKPPHLHYAIVSLIPMPWRVDGATQGYKKAFYLDPDRYLRGR